MINSKFIITKWNAKTKKYYECLGYNYTHIGETFAVNIEHLKKNSGETVEFICDYCGCVYQQKWSYYNRNKERNPNISKDACVDCVGLKTGESNLKQYGVYSVRQINEVQEKIKNTNLTKYGTPFYSQSCDFKSKLVATMQQKYGVDNPFQLECVKLKSKTTNIIKYGVPIVSQNPDIKRKVKFTKQSKYGIGSNCKLAKRGSEHHNWRGGISTVNHILRTSSEYKQWRNSVFDFFNYTCINCNQIGGKIHAHHIFDWANYEHLRFETSNGVVLCKNCHCGFHSEFKPPHNFEQLELFLQGNDEYDIC